METKLGQLCESLWERRRLGLQTCRSTIYASKVNINTGVQNGGGTHDEQDGDRVFATNGDEIGRVCVVAGPNDVDECAMVVSEVH